MTDKKFTDDEIIKALECCIKMEDCLKSKCPFSKEWGLCLGNEPQKLYLDLINRQKSEIERLNKKVEELSDVLSGTIRIRYAKAKSEAYKEFAEKLENICEEIMAQEWNEKTAPISWSYAYASFIDDIDNLLKEMVGEEE